MKGRASAFILNLIIILLSVNMLCLVYMYAARSVLPQSNDDPQFDNLWIVQNYNESAFTKFDTSLCLPSCIAYKQYKNELYGIYNNSELMQTVYPILSDVILDIFGKNSTIVTDEVFEYSETVSKIATAESYIIFDYASELPFNFIYAFSSGETSVRSEMCSPSPSVYISKIALIINENSQGVLEYECYCFDDSRTVYKFRFTNNEPYILSDADSAHLYAYSSDFKKLGLSYDQGSESGVLITNPLELMFGSFEYSQLSSDFNVKELSLDNQENVSSLLNIFDMNPEKTNSYIELDGTTAYIGLADRLVISFDGKLEFNSQDSLSMKNILGYSTSESSEYSMFDMLKATNIIIGKLSSLYPKYFGNQAVPKLTAAYKNSDGDPVFEYSYFYNDIKINTPTAYKFTFSASGLKSLYANTIGFAPGASKLTALSEKIIYSRISSENSQQLTDIIPVYAKTSDGLYSVTWYGK